MTADWPPPGPPDHEDGQPTPATLHKVLAKLDDLSEQLGEIRELLHGQTGTHHPGNPSAAPSLRDS